MKLSVLEWFIKHMDEIGASVFVHGAFFNIQIESKRSSASDGNRWRVTRAHLGVRRSPVKFQRKWNYCTFFGKYTVPQIYNTSPNSSWLMGLGQVDSVKMIQSGFVSNVGWVELWIMPLKTHYEMLRLNKNEPLFRVFIYIYLYVISVNWMIFSREIMQIDSSLRCDA